MSTSVEQGPIPERRRLTAREHEVWRLVAHGRSNRAIARDLCISSKTVEKHIQAIFAKLGLAADVDSHRRVILAVMYRTAAPCRSG